jgi:hypothetical protein
MRCYLLVEDLLLLSLVVGCRTLLMIFLIPAWMGDKMSSVGIAYISLVGCHGIQGIVTSDEKGGYKYKEDEVIIR